MKSKSVFHDAFHQLADYFTFSRLHRRGSVFLLLIILLLCSGFYFLNFLAPARPFNQLQFEKEVSRFEEAVNQAKIQTKKNMADIKSYSAKPDKTELSSHELFPFNPNILDEEGFTRLGLSRKQAQVILRYRAKGGRFRKKEDLKKMYCISIEEFQHLEPYIILPVDSMNRTVYIKDTSLFREIKPALSIYDLNNVNQAELDSMKGIGPAIASSILRYREKLGGYISVSQLLEVYGMDSVLYERIKGQLKLESANPVPIHINSAYEDELKHPYLNRNLAKLIVTYRKLHGPFKQVSDLKKLALVNDELYVKLAPYLTTE